MIKPNLFSGKTVLITGASSGLGAAFAEALAELGSNLILVARSEDKLNELKLKLLINKKIKINIYRIDLSVPSGPRSIYEKLKNDNLHVDILVNNAGFGKQGKFESIDPSVYEENIQLNIASVVLLTRLLVAGMLERGSGGVINMASTAAFQPLPYFAVYGAAKSFILSFSEALWAEYRKKGIRILAVCPGHVHTNFHKTAGVSTKKLFAIVTPGKVVKDALLAYQSGRPFRVYGFANYILAFLVRILSRRMVINIASKFFEGS